jgi:hypothetical protein
MALVGELNGPLEGKPRSFAVVDSHEYPMEHGHLVTVRRT